MEDVTAECLPFLNICNHPKNKERKKGQPTLMRKRLAVWLWVVRRTLLMSFPNRLGAAILFNLAWSPAKESSHGSSPCRLCFYNVIIYHQQWAILNSVLNRLSMCLTSACRCHALSSVAVIVNKEAPRDHRVIRRPPAAVPLGTDCLRNRYIKANNDECYSRMCDIWFLKWMLWDQTFFCNRWHTKRWLETFSFN